MMRVRLNGFEPLHVHERSTYYILFVNVQPKSVPLEKVAELRARYLWCFRTTLRLMLRGGPTKAEIIAIALNKLQIEDGETFAGIGCGTGNVSKANAL